MSAKPVTLLALLVLCLPAEASAHHTRGSLRSVTTAASGECPGRAISRDRVITGSFRREVQGSYVMVPFRVPEGTTAVRVKYCFDQPRSPLSSTPVFSIKNTLDLGLYEPPRGSRRFWGTREFRGWGGSSHPDVTVSAEGFSSEAQYLAKPRVDPAGTTTRAFRPGRIRPGMWAAELGVAAVVSPLEGNPSNEVGWRLEIELSTSRRFADEPYRRAEYDPAPARRSAGWYAGDLHVHGEHSAYGDAAMSELFGFAFRPRSQGGAGLDFVTLSDYVSGSSWDEVGRHQQRYPGKLIVRSAEVITYRGHLNNHGTRRVVDYRTGPVLERRSDGSLSQLRSARPAREIFAAIKAAGGFTQINHPTIFPSAVPGFANFCRGCSWEYDESETDYEKVDAFEVATGPYKGIVEGAPNPFTLSAIEFYDRLLGSGARPAALGVSDSHNAGRTPNPITQAPIGVGSTVVRAEELSEPGIECGIEAGHTYAKVTGSGGPDLRFEAVPRGGSGRATFGDTVQAGNADFIVRVIRGNGTRLSVVKDGSPVASYSIGGDDVTERFGDRGPGYYRLQLERGAIVETVSSPIWLEAGPGTVRSRDCRPLRVRGLVARRKRPTRHGRFRARCRARGARVRSCSVRVRATFGKQSRRRVRTLGKGRVRMAEGTRRVRIRLNKRGRRVVRRRKQGRRVRLEFVVSDGDGATARDVRRTKLIRRKKRR